MHFLRYHAVVFVVAAHLAFMPLSIAGVVLNIANSTVQEGSGGFVDVFIRSDGTDFLSDFSFDFRIEALNGGVRQLRFTSPQSDQQLNRANYVFAGGSIKRDGDALFGISPSSVGSVGTSFSGYLHDSFIGNDSVAPFANSSTGVLLDSQEKLLVRLDLTLALGLLSPRAGDQFRVSLASSPVTAFLDPNLSPLSFTSNVGIVQITAVPEPSSLSLFLVVAIFGTARFVFGAKNAQTQSIGKRMS
ncbi:MAG: PEP-CTERM sorting domain-containing protein [Pirellulaceae bacterium]|nr:PEP-CTERM sorting domain-containing protein [Pirellulaceae bacterium]